MFSRWKNFKSKSKKYDELSAAVREFIRKNNCDNRDYIARDIALEDMRNIVYPSVDVIPVGLPSEKQLIKRCLEYNEEIPYLTMAKLLAHYKPVMPKKIKETAFDEQLKWVKEQLRELLGINQSKKPQ